MAAGALGPLDPAKGFHSWTFFRETSFFPAPLLLVPRLGGVDPKVPLSSLRPSHKPCTSNAPFALDFLDQRGSALQLRG